MLRRTEEHYGAADTDFDTCSRIVAGCGSQGDALAGAWQWAKLADRRAHRLHTLEATKTDGSKFSADEVLGAPVAWRGLRQILESEGTQDALVVPCQGVSVHESKRRTAALYALGYSEEDARSYSDEVQDSQPDSVRHFLAAVLWLRFDLAAEACNSLRKHWPAGTTVVLPRLKLLMQMVAGLLERNGDGATRTEEADADSTSAASVSMINALKKSTQQLLGMDWSDAPASATLQMALRFLEVALAQCSLAGRPSTPGSTAASQTPDGTSRNMLGSDMNPEELRFQRLLRRTGHGGKSPRGKRQTSPTSPETKASLRLSPRRSGEESRPWLSFRCAIALRYLSYEALDEELKRMADECRQNGFTDGLFFEGLGGDDQAQSFSPEFLEDLVDECAMLKTQKEALQARPIVRAATQSRRASKAARARPAARDDDASWAEEPLRPLEAYLQRVGDVQSVALILARAAHLQKPPSLLVRCVAQYSALLSRWRLPRSRRELQALLKSRLQPEEVVKCYHGHKLTVEEIPYDGSCDICKMKITQGTSIRRCTKCQYDVCAKCQKDSCPTSHEKREPARGPVLFCVTCESPLTGPQPPRDGVKDVVMPRCANPKCGKAPPNCAVCLHPISVINTCASFPFGEQSSVGLAFENWVAWCQECNHGGHVGHLEEWFEENSSCPVAGCDCQCNSLS